MNEFIPDKKTYQSNRRRMAWAALGMMIVCTGAVILDPARMAQADAVAMTVIGSSIAVGPRAAVVVIDTIDDIIPAVGFPPTIVVAILIEPATASAHKHVADSDQYENTHRPKTARPSCSMWSRRQSCSREAANAQ